MDKQKQKHLLKIISPFIVMAILALVAHIVGVDNFIAGLSYLITPIIILGVVGGLLGYRYIIKKK